MTLTSLRALTWGTVTSAIVGALWLGAGDSGAPDWARLAWTRALSQASFVSGSTASSGHPGMNATLPAAFHSQRGAGTLIETTGAQDVR